MPRAVLPLDAVVPLDQGREGVVIVAARERAGLALPGGVDFAIVESQHTLSAALQLDFPTRTPMINVPPSCFCPATKNGSPGAAATVINGR